MLFRSAEKTRADLQQFLADGLHGDMAWLRDKADRRGDPKVLWPEARSVIMVGLNYGPEAWPARDPSRDGAISVYAQGADYHDVLKGRLKQLARWLAGGGA